MRLRSVLLNAEGDIYSEFMRRLKQGPGTYDWLRNPDHYRYIRLLYSQGRILSVKGNLLTTVSVPGLSASARKLDVPIRIFYTSNAEDKWELTPRYRGNLTSIPVDERSVFLRTIFPRSNNPDHEMWKYVVQSSLEAQRKLSRDGWKWTWFFDEDAHPSSPRNMSIIGLPGRTSN